MTNRIAEAATNASQSSMDMGTGLGGRGLLKIRSVLDPQPLALEDRLRESRNCLDVGFRFRFVRLLGLQPLPRRVDRLVEMLMVGFAGIELKPHFRLDLDYPLDLVE